VDRNIKTRPGFRYTWSARSLLPAERDEQSIECIYIIELEYCGSTNCPLAN